MIEDDERNWKAAIESRVQNDRAKAFHQHFAALALIILLLPAVIAGPVAVGELMRASNPQTVTHIFGSLFWVYFAILLWSLPVIVPVAISHIACVAILYGRGYLNWLSAACTGFVHGMAAVLLVAAVYAHGKDWPRLESLAVFGLAGTVVALLVHAAIALYRRSGRRATAP